MLIRLRSALMAKGLGLVVAGLVLSACTGQAPASSPTPRAEAITPDYRQTPSEARFKACADEGGELRQQGRIGAWTCVTLYADAGKVCRDKSDCLGRCAAVREEEPNASAPSPGQETGLCAADNSRFGCRAEIIKGRSTPWLCID